MVIGSVYNGHSLWFNLTTIHMAVRDPSNDPWNNTIPYFKHINTCRVLHERSITLYNAVCGTTDLIVILFVSSLVLFWICMKLAFFLHRPFTLSLCCDFLFQWRHCYVFNVFISLNVLMQFSFIIFHTSIHENYVIILSNHYLQEILHFSIIC